ncbi:MAG: translation initiation factor IF-2 [Candidatus Nanohaloarchaea archaeon]|nr:translation initiation factor IF-2 [Candidatus Nanohaloarchaea archaeon]
MTEEEKTENIRQPIISVLGHVNAGKTSLLDSIRGSIVVEKEAGSITQMIGATQVPLNTIEEICGDLLKTLDTELTIPGLLFIDTPGHAAFTSLRKRGGSLSDIAILVIDIEDGVQPQTREAIEILKQSKTPFIIALNKVDKLPGWKSEHESFMQNMKEQSSRLQDKLNETIYEIMGDLNDYGITAERFDKVDNFQKKVGIVPISAETGEGLPELLMVMSGLSQRYLKGGLQIHEGAGKGTVLEVNEVKGLGTTIDLILYDGVLEKEDKLLIGGETGVIETEIKALLEPKPLKEMRREKDFKHLKKVYPAAGVKIAADGLDAAVSGAPVRSVRSEENAEEARKEIEEELHDLSIETSSNGVVVKADSLGSLEAVSKEFKQKKIPISKAEVGKITKQDLVELEGSEDKYKVVFGFNTKITGSAEEFLKGKTGYKVITSEIVYELVEEYEEWRQELERLKREEKLSELSRPGKFRILPGHVFRSSKPAVVGVEVVEGAVSPGSKFMTPEGDVLGRIKSVQDEGESIDLAKKGDRVAVSLTDVQVGRQIDEGETLYTDVSSEDYKALKELEDRISQDELNALDKIVEIKDQRNPRWKIG